MLRASALECVRGERRLFSDLSFNLSAGALIEVRGANGSGKTTLLRALCGLFAPAGGSVTWRDTDIRALGDDYRCQLAYVGHLNAIKDDLTAVENLRAAARLAGLPSSHDNIMSALRAFGLETVLNLPCRALSQGQRRRVALARLQLSGSRPLWILDEPFSALDAAAMQLTQTLLESHLEHGGMAVLTTHQDISLRAGAIQRMELAP